jgi:hypothetical protein
MLIWLILTLLPAYAAPRMGPVPPLPGQEKEAPKDPPQRPATPNDALALVVADLKTLDAESRLYTRYVWVTDAELEQLQCVSLGFNYVSRATTLIRPVPLGVGSLMVARVDLRHYAPRERETEEWIRLWEEFRFDPAFNILITKGTLKFATDLGVKIPDAKKVVQKVQRREFKDQKIYDNQGKKQYYDDKTGKYYDQPYLDEPYNVTVSAIDGDVLRVVGLHLDPALVAYAVDVTHSQAPVVSHGYFLTRLLTTVQGKGVAKTLYGGLYYDFAGTRKGAKKGTDEDVLFEQLGVGNVEKGITAAKIFDDLRTDQRVAVFRSGVTGKPRRVDMLPTLAGRESRGLISVTHDLKAQDIDIDTHPIMNLLDFKDAAREVIFVRVNGLHGFALFNGEGILQEAVPQDVATDGSIPFPNFQVLQPAISCIRCHASEGGWRLLENDVKKLTTELDIFDDVGSRKSQPDVIDRLRGLYAGDMERKLLPFSRDDYAAAVLQAAGPWKKSKDQLDVVKVSGGRLAEEFAAYNYNQVDAARALRYLGEESPKDPKEAKSLLKKLLPPVPVDAGGFVREDPRLGILFAGGRINRTDWDLLAGFLHARLKARKQQ